MKAVAGVALGLAALSVFLHHPGALVAALVLAVLGAGLADPAALRTVLRLGALLGAVFAGAVTGAVVTLSAGWSRGVGVGSALLVRLLVLALVASVLARRVSADSILRTAHRLGFERVGLALGLALNSLPHLAEAARDVWAAQAVRCSSRWARLRALPRLAEVLLAHTARIGEEAAAAAALRGHAALGRRCLPITAPVRVVVATGATDSGKTTTMEAVVDEIKRRQRRVVGFLQPGIWRDGAKRGFRIRDVASGEEALLATEVGEGQGNLCTRYRFEEAGFALARRALEHASAGDLVVIDELGPLELRGQGHMATVRRALAVEGLGGVILSVRRQLVPLLLAALEAEDAEVVDLSHHGEGAPQAVVSALGLETR